MTNINNKRLKNNWEGIQNEQAQQLLNDNYKMSP